MIKQFILATLCLTLSIAQVFAAKETQTRRLSGEQVITGMVLTTQDNKFSQVMAGTSAFTDAGVKNTISVGVDHTHPLYGVNSPHLVFQLQIDWLNENGTLTSVNKDLEVNYDPGNGSYLDRSTHEFFGGYMVQVTILQILDKSGTPIPNPEDLFYLENTIETERYYAMQIAGYPNLSASLVSNASVDEIDIKWSYYQGAEYYDLEWVYVNNYDGSGGSKATSALEVNFDENATRVSTAEQHYTIPNLFTEGYVVFRVRAVGRFHNSTSGNYDVVPAYWSLPIGTQTLNTLPSTHVVAISANDAHHPEKNWQYTATFAEEGKKKEVMGYHDGMLRSRQNVTRINTDEQAVVAETYYDFHSRPAINVLPSPTGEDKIRYYDSFNRLSATTPYSWKDFDVDDPNQATNSCDPVVNPLYNGSGASRYYSSQNPDQSGFNAYIPDAAGYPYSQVKYTSDKTGRVRKQSGVGQEFRIGSGHETKMLYGIPSQEELDRLFGSEVGYAQHYRKTVTLDPNGQTSVAYADLVGNTVATAMSGDAPQNLMDLTDYQGNSVPGNSYPLDVDLLNKFNAGDPDTETDNNDLNQAGDALTFSKKHIVESAGAHDFSYTLERAIFDPSCLPQGVCYDCVYDLEIDVVDECGQSVSPFPYTQTIGSLDPAGLDTICGDDTTLFTMLPDPVTVYLAVGEYQIFKKLKVNAAARDTYWEDYKSRGDCVRSLQSFIDSALADVDSTKCISDTCDTCGAFVNTCLTSYQMLLFDMTPTGQYAQYLDDKGNIVPSDFDLSIFNDNNALPKNRDVNGNIVSGTASWKNPATPYTDANGALAKVEIFLINGTFKPETDNNTADVTTTVNGRTLYYAYPQNLKYIKDFVAKFDKANWPKSLVAYHPEYCYYEWCIQNEQNIASGIIQSSFDMEEALMTTQTLVDAQTKWGQNLLDPLGAPGDPFFIGGLGSSYNTDMASRINNYMGTGLSMYQIAAVMKHCGNVFDQTAMNTCLSAVYGSPSNHLSYISDDEIWLNFRNLYLAERERIKSQLADDYALSTCNGFNECIGETEFDVFVSGMISASGTQFPAMTLANLSGTVFNKKQPCSVFTSELYKDKIKRYHGADDGLEGYDDADEMTREKAEEADYQMYQLTGQCPTELDVQAVFHGLAAKGHLMPSGSGVNLNQKGMIAKDLYDLINTSGTYSDLFWTSSVSGNSATFLVHDNASQQKGYLKLTFPNGGNFSNIEGFFYLRYQNSSGGLHAFTITALVDDDGDPATPPVKETMQGETDIQLGGCSFDPKCAPSELAQALTGLWTLLALNGDLQQMTAVNLGASPYQNYFNTRLKHLLGNGSWTWMYDPFLDMYTLSDGSFSIETVFATSLSSNTSGFRSLKPEPNMVGDFSVKVYQNGVTPGTEESGTITFVNPPSGYNYSIGDCQPDLPLLCQNTEVYNKLALEKFLDEIGPTITSSRDLDVGTPSFGTQLRAPFNSNALEWTGFSPCVDCTTMTSEIVTDNTSEVHCEFDLKITNAVPASDYNFNNIVAFHSMQAVGPVINNQFYHFTVVAEFQNGQTRVVEGSSCYAINNCCNEEEDVFLETFDDVSDATQYIPGGALYTQYNVGNVYMPPYVSSYPNYASVKTSNNGSNDAYGYSLPHIVDHTTGSATGNSHYVIYSIGQDEVIWEYNFTGLETETDYEFTFHSYMGESPLSDFNFEVTVDGVPSTQFQSFVTYGGQVANWTQNTYRFSTGSNTSAFIEIVGKTLGASPGAVFGLDDISLRADKCSMNPGSYDFPTVELEDPCIEQLVNAAYTNAKVRYKNYIREREKEFEKLYTEQCIGAAVETFRMAYNSGQYYHTLYYYDLGGNLVKTVPPEGVSIITNTADLNGVKVDRSTGAPNVQKVYKHHHYLETHYHYNSLQQLVMQETPDGGISKFWYDELGRLVLSQNAKQSAANPARFAYTLFDNLGRPVEAGEIEDGTLGGNLPSSGNVNYTTYASLIFNTTGVKREVVHTFYDDPIVGNPWQVRFRKGSQNNLYNRVVSITFQEVYHSSPLVFDHATHYSYDIHGNVDELVQDYPDLEPLTQRYKHLGYMYDLVSGNVNQVSYNDVDWISGESFEDAFHHRYEYDGDNRITNVFTSKDGHTWDQDAKYAYYAHGPLARTEIGELKVQTQDYAYTLQGWMKGVNSHTLQTNRDMGKDGHIDANNSHQFIAPDVYGYGLNYYEGDYTDIAGIAQVDHFASNATSAPSYGTHTKDLWNGNIKSMVTTMVDPVQGFAPVAHLNAYRYDQLNRIKKSKVYQGPDINANAWIASALDFYQTSYNYDLNGNIMQLTRNGNLSGADLLMDDLNYRYHRDPVTGRLDHHQLLLVEEGVSNSVYTDDYELDLSKLPNPVFDPNNPGNTQTHNFLYDEVGNLIKDRTEEIHTILWTAKGKVKAIVREQGSLKSDLDFRYDAGGNRILKVVKPRNSSGLLPEGQWVYTYYVRDAQDEVMAVYKKTLEDLGSTQFEEKLSLAERPVYGSKRVGQLQRSYDLTQNMFTSLGTLPSGEEERGTYGMAVLVQPDFQEHYQGGRAYELSNHLGNVLAVVSDQPQFSGQTTVNDQFTSGLDGWNACGNSSLANSNGYLEVTTNASTTNNCAWKPMNITQGMVYRFELDFYPGTVPQCEFVLYGMLTQVLKPGKNVIYHTATYTGLLYPMIQPLGGGGIAGNYYLDNIRLIEAPAMDAEVLAVNDYYPFGMLMPGRSYVGGEYRYGFQGQETDDELAGLGNSVSYKYRIHDVRIGRFLSVDPLAPDYPHNAPYAFSENRLIDGVELEGLERVPVGKIVQTFEYHDDCRNCGTDIIKQTTTEHIEYKDGSSHDIYRTTIVKIDDQGVISSIIENATVYYKESSTQEVPEVYPTQTFDLTAQGRGSSAIGWRMGQVVDETAKLKRLGGLSPVQIRANEISDNWETAGGVVTVAGATVTTVGLAADVGVVTLPAGIPLTAIGAAIDYAGVAMMMRSDLEAEKIQIEHDPATTHSSTDDKEEYAPASNHDRIRLEGN